MPRRPPSRLKLFAAAADANKTLLAFVADRGGLPERDARAAIERGGAYLDGKRVRDPAQKLKAGAKVEVQLRDDTLAAALPLPVLYEDALVIAVDKPAGVLAQEGLAGGPALPELLHARLVHRLDRGTTGVIVLAKTRAAQAHLLEAFRARQVHKEYRALVAGQPELDEGQIVEPVDGQEAHTRYRVLERFAAAGGAALVAAFPETGRTHQVRLHLASLGCPLLGDARYGGPRMLTRADGRRFDAQRPLLHALALDVPHPNGQRLALRAPEPADLIDACNFLRLAAPADPG